MFQNRYEVPGYLITKRLNTKIFSPVGWTRFCGHLIIIVLESKNNYNIIHKPYGYIYLIFMKI